MCYNKKHWSPVFNILSRDISTLLSSSSRIQQGFHPFFVVVMSSSSLRRSSTGAHRRSKNSRRKKKSGHHSSTALTTDDVEYLKKNTRYDEQEIREWYKGFKVRVYKTYKIACKVIKP